MFPMEHFTVLDDDFSLCELSRPEVIQHFMNSLYKFHHTVGKKPIDCHIICHVDKHISQLGELQHN